MPLPNRYRSKSLIMVGTSAILALLGALLALLLRNLDQPNMPPGVSHDAFYLLAFIGVVLIGLATVIVQRTGRTESLLTAQGERIRALYEVSARSDLTLDEQVTETLRLGCRLLNMEVGKVGRLDPVQNTSTFLNTVAPTELGLQRGMVWPLDKTFCNITFASNGPIALHHISQSNYQRHSAARFLGVQAYIGTTIKVHGQKFGTLNFSNRAPHTEAFTTLDTDLVNLMGSWISVMLERQTYEQELARAKETAEAMSEAKSKFLASMSHEIRTPLTAILGYSEMLLDNNSGPEQRAHDLQAIIHSSKHLQHITNDILDLSKIEAKRLVLEYLPVSPVLLLTEVQDVLITRAHQKKLNLKVEYQLPLPKHIITDATRLKQILINLIGNAIKFTEQGHVSVSVQYRKASHQIAFCITDTGVGIRASDLDHVFDAFAQAGSGTAHSYGGTGLGLNISRQLAQRLGGDIQVSSLEHQGSTFTATVDIGPLGNCPLLYDIDVDQVIAIGSDYDIDYRGLTGKVLLAEDSREHQELIAHCIQKTGALVDVVSNGREALEHAARHAYDLIVMDLQMPVLDGLQALHQLRAAKNTVPVVCLTAQALLENRQNCLQAGANVYLTKPLDMQNFYRVLKDFLPTGGVPLDVMAASNLPLNLPWHPTVDKQPQPL